MNVVIPADLIVKIEESKKSDNYLHLARELRKLWNMRVTVIPIVIGALGTVPKGIRKGSGRIGNWRKNRDCPNWRPQETICHSDSSERSSANVGVKNSQEVK